MGIEELPALRLAFLFHRKHLQHNTESGDTRQRGMFQTKRQTRSYSISKYRRPCGSSPATLPLNPVGLILRRLNACCVEERYTNLTDMQNRARQSQDCK